MKISIRQGTGLFFLIAFLVIGGVFIFSQNAMAQGGTTAPGEGGTTAPGQTFTIENKFAFDTLEEALSAIANFLFIISIPIAVIFIIIGGFQFATAAGNPEKINAGKKTITWAVIGIVVLLVAGSIAKLIENILT